MADLSLRERAKLALEAHRAEEEIRQQMAAQERSKARAKAFATMMRPILGAEWRSVLAPLGDVDEVTIEGIHFALDSAYTDPKAKAPDRLSVSLVSDHGSKGFASEIRTLEDLGAFLASADEYFTGEASPADAPTVGDAAAGMAEPGGRS